VIVPDLDDPATQDVLRVFRGEATVAEAPPTEPPASTTDGSTSAAPAGPTQAPATTTTVAAPTDGTGPTTTVGPSVLIEDNGVGIFPPDDPSCR
jgi:hypothetical protein